MAEADPLGDPAVIGDVKVSLALGGHLFDSIDKLKRRRPALAGPVSPDAVWLFIRLEGQLNRQSNLCRDPANSRLNR